MPDADRWAERYAAVKQEHLVTLIEAGEFTAFPDAIRFVLATKAAGIPSRRGVLVQERRPPAATGPAG